MLYEVITGYRPDLKVEVTIKSDVITSIEIISSNETPSFFSRVETLIPNRILEAHRITSYNVCYTKLLRKSP